MNPIAYRVVRAPLRSLLFGLLGLAALMYASATLARYAGPSVSGIIPFLLLVVLGGIAAYGAWYARDHRQPQPPAQGRLSLAHAGLLLIGALCALSALDTAMGLMIALALALAAISLARVREERLLAAQRHEPVLSDAEVARVLS